MAARRTSMYDTLFSCGCQCPLTLAELLPGSFLIWRSAGNGGCAGSAFPGDDARVDIAEPGQGRQDGPFFDVLLQLFFRNPQVFVLFPCSDVYVGNGPDDTLGGTDVDAEAVGHVRGGEKLGGHMVLPFFIWEMRKGISFYWLCRKEGCYSGLDIKKQAVVSLYLL